MLTDRKSVAASTPDQISSSTVPLLSPSDANLHGIKDSHVVLVETSSN